MSDGNTIAMTYKERLQADYERIRADTKSGALPLPQRMDEIQQATDRYALAHAEEYDAAVAEGRSPGTVPIPFKDTGLLHNLADLCMDEYLRWSHPDKMTIVEYPVMSFTQRQERLKDEINTDFSDEDDNTNDNHVRINAYLATDGKSYRYPKRRTKDIGELIAEDYRKSSEKNKRSPVITDILPR